MADEDVVLPDIDTLALELAEAATAYGFDLCAHTTVAAYHRALGLRDDSPGFRFPDYGTASIGAAAALPRPSRAVILVGNTRDVWPAFMDALAVDPARRDDPHPFDRWTSEVLSRVVVMVVGPHYAFDLRFAFEGGVRAWGALHLAEACGLAYRGPAGLAINPELGPWFALRAAVVVDVPGREAPPPDPVCERCADKPCLAALSAAIGEGPREGLPHAEVRERWRAWLAVRDACPVGVEHRYSDAQIRWHYAHDRSALR